PCLRNGVKQAVLQEYVEKYLDQAGQRLDIMMSGPNGVGHLTDRLEGQEAGAWRAFCEGMDRLTDYLAEHHPHEYAAVLQEFARRREEDEAATRNAVPLKPP